MKFHERGDAQQAAKLLTGLRSTVPEIRSLTLALDELDTPVSYHLFMMTTHNSESELAAYQRHPAHREIAEWLIPRLVSRAVVDYRE
ncbi:Dabb family protein [Nocardia goodfellowii]|uniref:Stress-response A/B barrel domain-containing protein n=1 Tax=Nocardia goodfellowii TaxID=882446 RepID=A0ABS4QM26_9NOCA|nr:Dabb family protein [Nocardia goodfellowii]MBP2192745.1 hypothetical protein [Nocardia goodfellowii]